MYHRMSELSERSPCCAFVRAAGSSSATSRLFAHFSAAERCANVFVSRWMSCLPFRIRAIAEYRIVLSACFRARMPW